MDKNYFYIITFLFCFFTLNLTAQENKTNTKNQSASVEEISFYPNPVSNGKLYINSKFSGDRDVSIFDVLGKKVFQTTQNIKELNISTISSGVYIIKIREGETTLTRKLIVK